MLGLIMEKSSKVKRTPPRSPRRSGVCRKLTFGSSSPLRRHDTHRVYQQEMLSMAQANSSKWNYDFLQEVELTGPYKYKVIATTPEKQAPRRASTTKRKSPGKVKRRSPSKTPGCSCVEATSNHSSPNRRRGTLDFKTEAFGMSVSALTKVDSSLVKPAGEAGGLVMPCDTCHSENVCPVRRMRAAGVVRNLAALYWSDTNNNSPIKNTNCNDYMINNNNNIINKNINNNVINNNSSNNNNNNISDIKEQTQYQCSPLRMDYLDPSEDCENSPRARLQPGGPHPGGYSNTCLVTPERRLRLGIRRKQSQITDFFCQQKALRLQEKHQKHHYHHLRHPYHPQQQQKQQS